MSQRLTVRPIGVSLLTLTPSTVVGGKASLGTATIECVAAPGPITVDLASGNGAVAYPVAPAVVVPQGLRSATFDVATNPVGRATSVSIAGTAKGVRKSKTLKVNTAASVSPTSLRFGNVAVGAVSALLTVELRNKGSVPFAVLGIQMDGGSAERFLKQTTCPGNLATGASCTIGVRFSPTATGQKFATLRIDTNAELGHIAVPVSGTGIASP